MSAVLSIGRMLKLAIASGVGGFFGAASRGAATFAVTSLGLPTWSGRASVNVVGALLAGWFVGRWLLPEATDPLKSGAQGVRWREHLVITGFLGGLTTVSGVASDLVLALEGSVESGPRWGEVAATLAVSGVVGIAAAWAGWRAARGKTPTTSA